MGSRRISLEVYQGPWAPDDKDANFKEEVAHYSRVDPMTTLDRMSHNLGIPVGALVRYILVKWAASGSEGLMEIGPRRSGRKRCGRPATATASPPDGQKE